MIHLVRTLAGCLLLSLLAPACSSVALAATAAPAAQSGSGRTARQSAGPTVYAYKLRYRAASEMINQVFPLLSPQGTVELQPGSNTLVLRDSTAKINQIVQMLREGDRPAQPMRLELLIVRASRAAVSPPVRRSDLPEELTRKLRAILPYDIYELEAQAQLSSLEGEEVMYEIGDSFQVGFRLGSALSNGRVKLSDFQLVHSGRAAKGGRQKLVHTNLNLWLDKPLSLGLAGSESSREALMLVLTLRKEK